MGSQAPIIVRRGPTISALIAVATAPRKTFLAGQDMERIPWSFPSANVIGRSENLAIVVQPI
jgi:hypothetical protein